MEKEDEGKGSDTYLTSAKLWGQPDAAELRSEAHDGFPVNPSLDFDLDGAGEPGDLVSVIQMLFVCGVKDKSKVVLVEDPISQEKSCRRPGLGGVNLVTEAAEEVNIGALNNGVEPVEGDEALKVNEGTPLACRNDSLTKVVVDEAANNVRRDEWEIGERWAVPDVGRRREAKNGSHSSQPSTQFHEQLIQPSTPTPNRKYEKGSYRGDCGWQTQRIHWWSSSVRKAAIESWERLAARERVAIEAELEAVAVTVVGVARVVGPEEEEGADSVAAARFQLRVSIQKAQTPQSRESPRHRTPTRSIRALHQRRQRLHAAGLRLPVRISHAAVGEDPKALLHVARAPRPILPLHSFNSRTQ
nr:hypothetical protein Iba_chr09eCG11530 [Ipomoea batatas]